MTIEQYLDEVCYKWEKALEFNRGAARFVAVDEYDTNNEKETYFLYEEDGNIYNAQNELIVENGVILEEG